MDASCTPCAMRRRPATASRGLALCGTLALALGATVYLTDRVAGSASLLPAMLVITGAPVFGTAGAWLPSLAHTAGFGLLTAAALPARRSCRGAAVVGWLAVGAAFEVAQHPSLAPEVAATARWFGTSALARYVLAGRFDPVDLLAGVLGAVAALTLVVIFTPAQEESA